MPALNNGPRGSKPSHTARPPPIAEALRFRPLLVFAGIAALARVALMYMYFPAILLAFDSPRYARADGMGIFDDFWMPAGYAMFLCTLRALTNQLWVTIAVQHALGLATGLLLYLALVRLGVKRWLACIPAGVVFFSGDQLYLEHSLMADFFLTFTATAGFTAAAFWLTNRRTWWWLAAASALFAWASLVRSVGVVLLPVLLLVVLFGTDQGVRQRLYAVAVAVLPALLVFGLYAGGCAAVGGRYLGISDMRGWNLYSRVAPFADCTKFTPPPGTEILCETRAPAQRPGPFGYVWDLQSVPRLMFQLGPETAKTLETFAYEAIQNQPLEYARAVLLDLARFVEPSLNADRPLAGQPKEIVSFGWHDEDIQGMVVRAMSWSYRGTEVTLRAKEFLGTYQSYVSVRGSLLVPLLVLSILGAWHARGTLRLAVILFGLGAFGLYALPVLTVSYDFRYGIPPGIFLATSGVLGSVACGRRVAARRLPVIAAHQ